MSLTSCAHKSYRSFDAILRCFVKLKHNFKTHILKTNHNSNIIWPWVNYSRSFIWPEPYLFKFTILSITLALKAQFFHEICQNKAEKLIFQIRLVSSLTKPSFFSHKWPKIEWKYKKIKQIWQSFATNMTIVSIWFDLFKPVLAKLSQNQESEMNWKLFKYMSRA